MAQEAKKKIVVRVQVTHKTANWINVSRFSTLARLARTVGWMLRFWNALLKQDQNHKVKATVRLLNGKIPLLSAAEVGAAELAIFRSMQQEGLSTLYTDLQEKGYQGRPHISSLGQD